MKKQLFVLLFFGAVLSAGQPARAQHSRIGIGGMINGPTGLSAKAWLTDDFAVDGAFSFGLAPNSSHFYLHSDALKHRELEVDGFKAYYGMGLRFIWTDVGDNLFAGIRWPAGLAYTLKEEDLESFFELAPTIDVAPGFRFAFNGALGIRIYLN